MNTWQSMTPYPLGVRPNVGALLPVLPAAFSVMVVGDSISYGYPGDLNDAWRLDLYRLLTVRGGLAPTFIGPQVSGSGSGSDNWTHSRAVVGFTVPNHQSTIASVIGPGSPFHPDMAIILLGSNDAQNDADATNYAVNLENFVLQVLGLEPDIVFVLAKPPIGGNAATQARFSASVWPGFDTAVAALQTASVPLIEVDLRVLSWGPDMLGNEAGSYIHPNPVGYLKLADVFFPAVMNAAGYEATW